MLPFPNAGALMPNVQPQYIAYTSARRSGAALLPAGRLRCPEPPCECPSTSQFGAGPRHAWGWPCPSTALYNVLHEAVCCRNRLLRLSRHFY